MDIKKKEWIKNNSVSIIVHSLIIFVYMSLIFTTLELYGNILSESDMLNNIFASVTVFGSFTFFSLFMIYLDMWSRRVTEFKKDYRKHMEK